jgi:hypothetical protein
MKFLTRAYHASKLALKANAPTIMVTTGVVAMGASVITASKQTLKAEEVLAVHVPKLEKIQEARSLDVKSYQDEEALKDRFTVYSATAWDLGKLYAVHTVLFVGGACLVFGGHRMMLKRNASLALAFTTLQKAYNKYRENVTHEMGPDFDRAMAGGFRNREILDEKTGKVATVSEYDWDSDISDPYNQVFDQSTSSQWEPDLGINKGFIAFQQEYAQERLNRQQILYLSDVYKALGLMETPMSRLVGWKVRFNPDGSRDIPVVDFGINKTENQKFMYGPDHSIYLDFNCQGLIIGGMVQKIMEQA